MHNVIVVVAPVFALIAIGFAAGRLKLISEIRAKGLAEFTFNLGIPALLFRKMATADLAARNNLAPHSASGSVALGTVLAAASATVVISALK